MRLNVNLSGLKRIFRPDPVVVVNIDPKAALRAQLVTKKAEQASLTDALAKVTAEVGALEAAIAA